MRGLVQIHVILKCLLLVCNSGEHFSSLFAFVHIIDQCMKVSYQSLMKMKICIFLFTNKENIIAIAPYLILGSHP